MEEVVDQLISKIVNSLKQDKDLDKDYFMAGDAIYTKRDIIENLKDRTEFGISILTNVCLQTLESMSKGKQVI